MKSLLKAHYSFKRKLEQKLKKYGFNSATGKIILYISENEGCQQNDIARDCFVTTSSLSSVLKKMEKNGWITREYTDENRRSYSIHSTDKSREIFKTVREQFDITIDNALEGFSENEVSELRAYLERVAKNLNK